MQCQKIAEKLKQNLPSVSTERREAQPLREERDPFTFLRIAAVNIREAREDLKYIGCYHACRNGAMEILYHAVRQDARLEYAGILHGSVHFLHENPMESEVRKTIALHRTGIQLWNGGVKGCPFIGKPSMDFSIIQLFNHI